MVELSYPCPENTGEMKKVPGGNYCESCSKVILDFTGMSNEEVKQALTENPGGCGVFTSEQVSRKNTNEFRSLFRIAFTMVFVLGLSVSSLHAQSSDANPNVHVAKFEPGKSALKGHVYDKRGNGVSNAKVTIYTENGSVVVRTDEGGYFELNSDQCPAGDKLELYIKAKKMQPVYVNLEGLRTTSFNVDVNLYAKPGRSHYRRSRRMAGAYYPL